MSSRVQDIIMSRIHYSKIILFQDVIVSKIHYSKISLLKDFIISRLIYQMIDLCKAFYQELNKEIMIIYKTNYQRTNCLLLSPIVSPRTFPEPKKPITLHQTV